MSATHPVATMLLPAWRSYIALTKPRVVSLIVLTALVGSLMASPGMPAIGTVACAALGIALAAASAAAFNHVFDRNIDAGMSRTRSRPIPTGQVSSGPAMVFAAALAAASMALLWFAVNPLTAALTLGSVIGYAVVYTLWLKHATPQNIVWGGAAGAAPPVLGWTAVTNHVAPQSILLFLIVFIWTPPHFWALAIARRHEYARVNVPMLPVIRGVPYTQRSIWVYSLVLVPTSLLPVMVGMSGVLYLLVASGLGAWFLRLAYQLRRDASDQRAMRLFRYSIAYLGWLFAALLLDHYLPGHPG